MSSEIEFISGLNSEQKFEELMLKVLSFKPTNVFDTLLKHKKLCFPQGPLDRLEAWREINVGGRN